MLPHAAFLGADTYLVHIDVEEPREALVEAEITPTTDGIISLSRNGRDTGLLHGWATLVQLSKTALAVVSQDVVQK